MIVLSNITTSNSETIAGTMSAIACFFVMLTYAIFKDLRNLRYVELVFYVALNDFIGSIGIALGSQPNNSAACWFQGISTTLNYLSSMFWITVISYQVWLIVHKRTVIKNMIVIHCICWGWPTLMALLPLTTNMYGNDDDGESWCFISKLHGSPSWGKDTWELLSFYLWLWIAILVNIGFLVSVSMRFQKMAVVTQDVAVTMTKLVWYPAILIVCWSSSTVLYFYYAYGSGQGDHTTLYFVGRFSNVICILQGFFSSIAFFVFNITARNKWKVFLYYLFCQGRLVLNDGQATRKGGLSASSRDTKEVRDSMGGTTIATAASRSAAEDNDCVYEGGGRGSLDDPDYLGNKSLWDASDLALPTTEHHDIDYIEPSRAQRTVSVGMFSNRISAALGSMRRSSANGPANTFLDAFSAERGVGVSRHSGMDSNAAQAATNGAGRASSTGRISAITRRESATPSSSAPTDTHNALHDPRPHDAADNL